MENIIEILETLESDNSRLFKESILFPRKNNELLHRFFTLAFDPWKNWGVSKYDKPTTAGTRGHSNELVAEFLDLLIRLDNRELKGNAARQAVTNIMSSGDELAQKWLERLLWRNLRCGVSSTTVNKVWPNTVVPFAVALAGSLPTKGVNGNFVISEPITYPVRVEAKLDGLRVVAVKSKGEVTLYTRNGTVLDSPGVQHIIQAIKELPDDNFVLDGELLANGNWNDTVTAAMKGRSS